MKVDAQRSKAAGEENREDTMNRLLLGVLCLGLLGCDPLQPTHPRAPEDERQDFGAPIANIAKLMAPAGLGCSLQEAMSFQAGAERLYLGIGLADAVKGSLVQQIRL